MENGQNPQSLPEKILQAAATKQVSEKLGILLLHPKRLQSLFLSFV